MATASYRPEAATRDGLLFGSAEAQPCYAEQMKFVDTATCVTERFSIGREVESGRCYLSVPVSNQLCDYEEYYEISQADHDTYPSNLPSLVAFAARCRARLNDAFLIVPPGTDRGVA